MRRFLGNPTVRGLALVALVALVIVLLSLEEVLLTAQALLSVAFFLAVAFFLFLVWRERRADIEAWSDRSRRTFYAAIALAVLDIAVLIAFSPTGLDALVFFVVLAACAWAIVRVWRDEHRYSSEL
jgi:amino acid transporter